MILRGLAKLEDRWPGKDSSLASSTSSSRSIWVTIAAPVFRCAVLAGLQLDRFGAALEVLDQ